MVYKTNSQKKRYNKISLSVIMLVLCVCGFSLLYKNYGESDLKEKIPAHNVSTDVKTTIDITANVEDSTAKLTVQQLQVLKDYALGYANTLAYLEQCDISKTYADTSSREYAVNKTALEVLIAIRSMRDMDLTLEAAKVEYIVDTVENKGDTVVVHLKENNTQKFRHLDQPSYSANLYHKFTLIEKDGQWLIKEHYHEEDFYLLAIEGWEDAKGETNAQRGENALALIVADAKDNLSDLSQFQQGAYYTDLKVSDTSYDRQRAVDYAQRWWNERNYTSTYLAYDEFGGNCQNFASQCLYAGGLKMDHTGTIDNQWKFYSEDLNSKQTASGRSYSWTGVDMFYSYAVASYKSGLVSLTDIDFKYAEKGDIIHVGAYYQWRHALVITDVLKNDDGTVKDIIVASNTADRWNYPLSAYIYTAPRLIHILGQN